MCVEQRFQPAPVKPVGYFDAWRKDKLRDETGETPVLRWRCKSNRQIVELFSAAFTIFHCIRSQALIL
jgi:hypothetical protein